MTDTCAICEHAKVEAINAALKTGVAPGIIARRYRLEPLLMKAHHEHRMQSERGIISKEQRSSIASVLIAVGGNVPREVTENPLSQFKQAWQMAKDDGSMRARMVSWLREQIAASGEEFFCS